MIDGTVFENGALAAVIWLLVEIAAINWALVEFFEFNLLDVLPADVQPIAIGIIGVAAAIALLDSVGVIEDLSEVLDQ